MQLRNLAVTSAVCASQVVLSAYTITVPNQVAFGNSVAQLISGASGLDGPKVFPEVKAVEESSATASLCFTCLQPLVSPKSPTIIDQFDPLKLAQSGAAPLGPEMQKAASLKLGKSKTFISLMWRLSETTGCASSNLWSPNDETGSVGLLMPNLSFRPVDDVMKDAKSGERGEIKGPLVSKGYHNNPKAVADSMLDDWFCTGDIGVLRGQQLYIVGRKKELIIYKAHQVAPAELEALLLSHSKILDAAVIGIEGEEQNCPEHTWSLIRLKYQWRKYTSLPIMQWQDTSGSEEAYSS